MALVSAGEVLKKVLGEFKIDDSFQEICFLWKKHLGKLAEHSQVVSFRDGCLVITVDNSVYMQELTLRKTEVLEKINVFLEGKVLIKEIKFRAGSIG